MAKRKAYYVKDENGKWTQINELPDHSIEQLSFTFEDDIEQTEKLKEGYSEEFTVELEPEEIRELYYTLYDPDDIRDRVIDCVDAIRNSYLNGAYYVAHAENTEDILKADKISKEDALVACHKLAEILDVYVEACENEYLIERNPIMKSFMAKDLN